MNAKQLAASCREHVQVEKHTTNPSMPQLGEKKNYLACYEICFVRNVFVFVFLQIV